MSETTKNTKPPGIDESQRIELSRHPIDLYKILKFEGLAASGGEAKAAIAGGLVMVNDAVETQKRKKIVSGDTIRFGEQLYTVHCDAELELPKVKTDEEIAAKKAKATPKAKVKDWRKRTRDKKAGRAGIGIKSK